MRLAGVDPMAGTTLVGDIDAEMFELIEKVGERIADLMTVLVRSNRPDRRRDDNFDEIGEDNDETGATLLTTVADPIDLYAQQGRRRGPVWDELGEGWA